MKGKLQKFSVKLLASMLAVIMSIPANAFAMVGDNSNTYTENTSVMGIQAAEETKDNNIQKALLKSELSTDESDDYIIEKSASLSKTTGQIDYIIKIINKTPEKESSDKQTTTFAITQNTDLLDLKVEKVQALDANGNEEEINYTQGTPNAFNSTDNIRSTGITTNKPQNGVVYYLSAKLTDQALKDLEQKSPQLALDFTIASPDNKIYQDRYALEIEKAITIDNEGNIANPEGRLVENQESLHLYKGEYKEEQKGIFQSIPAQIIWTDYINAKDNKEFTYDINLDQGQDTRESQVKIEYYEAQEKGYVLNESFTKTLAFANNLKLSIPEGYIAKVELNTRPKENTKEFAYNGIKIPNPTYTEEKNEAKEEQASDDADPLPNIFSKNDEELNSSNDSITDQKDQNFFTNSKTDPVENLSAIALNKDAYFEKLKSDDKLTTNIEEATNKIEQILEAYNKEEINWDDFKQSVQNIKNDKEIDESQTKDILASLLIGLNEEKYKVANIDIDQAAGSDTEEKTEETADQARTEEGKDLSDKTPDELAAEKLAEEGVTIEDFQNYMYELEEKYNLTNEDADRIYTANAEAIQALVTKAQEEKTTGDVFGIFDFLGNIFNPTNPGTNTGNTQPSGFSDKKFNIITSIDLSTATGPIPVSQQITLKLSDYLTVKSGTTINDLTNDKGTVIAKGRYNASSNSIVYKFTAPVTSSTTVKLNQAVDFNTNRIGNQQNIDVKNTLSGPGLFSDRNLPTVTVNANDKNPSTSTVLDSGRSRAEYPYQLPYKAYSTYSSGFGQNGLLTWNVEIDTRLLQNYPDLDYGDYLNLELSLPKDGLSNARITSSNTSSVANNTSFTTNSTKYSLNKQISKSSIPADGMIRLSISADVTGADKYYDLGMKLTPQNNYMPELIDSVKRNQPPNLPPFLISWIEGLSEAERLANGFSLIDTKIPSAEVMSINDDFVDRAVTDGRIIAQYNPNDPEAGVPTPGINGQKPSYHQVYSPGGQVMRIYENGDIVTCLNIGYTQPGVASAGNGYKDFFNSDIVTRDPKKQRQYSIQRYVINTPEELFQYMKASRYKSTNMTAADKKYSYDTLKRVYYYFYTREEFQKLSEKDQYDTLRYAVYKAVEKGNNYVVDDNYANESKALGDRLWSLAKAPGSVDQAYIDQVVDIVVYGHDEWGEKLNANSTQHLVTGKIKKPYYFVKTDTKGKIVPGAQFEIRYANGTVVKDANGQAIRWTSGNAPKEIFLSPGDYELHEIVSPANHIGLKNPVKFTAGEVNINTNAQYKLSTQTELIKGTDINVNYVLKNVGSEYQNGTNLISVKSDDTLLVANAPEREEPQNPSITIRKIGKDENENEYPLLGAEFTLTKVNSYNENVSSSVDSRGIISFKNLELNSSYTLRETKAPNGYQKTDKVWSVKVDSDGNVTINGDATNSISYFNGDNNELTVINIPEDKPNTGNFKIKKVDTDKKPLGNVGFTLYTDKNNMRSAITVDGKTEFFTNSEGYLYFSNLPYGTYYLKETTIPAGYTIKGSEWKVVTVKDGEAIISDSEPTTTSKPVTDTNGIVISNTQPNDSDNWVDYEIVNEESPIDIEFIKVGLKSHYLTPEDIYNGTLEGAVIKLQKLEGNEYKDTVQSSTSDENGIVKFENLTAGEYQLIETTVPDGYRNPGGPVKKFTVKMTENGLKAFVNGTEELISTGDNANNYIYNERKGKGELKVSKKGENSELLEGADFTLYRFEFTDSGDSIETITTDRNGIAHFKNLPYGKYWLVETKSPDGYIRNPEPRLITISHEYNVPQVAGKDVSSQLTLNKYSDPLPNISSSSGSERVVYPNNAEGLKVNLNYIVNPNSDIKPGDYFYLSISDNIDFDGVFNVDTVVKAGGHDIIGSQGTVAKASVVTTNGKKYLKYTFTDYVKDRKLEDINMTLPLFINRTNVQDNGTQNMSIGIGSPTNRREIFTDSIYVNYKDFYEKHPSAYVVNSIPTKVDPATGYFRTIVYANERDEYSWNKRITFSSNRNLTGLTYKVYEQNGYLPPSYGITSPGKLINTYGSYTLNKGYQQTINLGPNNQYNSNTYYVVIEGYLDNKSFTEFKTRVRYESYIDNYYNSTNYYWDNEVKNYQPKYNSDGKLVYQMPVEVTVSNSKNEVEYTKIEALEGSTENNDTTSTSDVDTSVTQNKDNAITAINGAKFELRKLDEATGKYEKVQGSEQESKGGGKLKWKELDPGKYEVWETKAAEGYETPKEAVAKFTVNEDGLVSKVGRDENNKDNVISQPYIGNKKIAKGKFKLLKVDAENNALEGVEFNLTSPNSYNKTLKSDGAGEIRFTDLQPGTYTLKETSTQRGYIKTNQKWTVKVDPNGKTTITPISNLASNNQFGVELFNTVYAASTNEPINFVFIVENVTSRSENTVDEFNKQIGTIAQTLYNRYGDNARIAVISNGYNKQVVDKNWSKASDMYDYQLEMDPDVNPDNDNYGGHLDNAIYTAKNELLKNSSNNHIIILEENYDNGWTAMYDNGKGNLEATDDVKSVTVIAHDYSPGVIDSKALSGLGLTSDYQTRNEEEFKNLTTTLSKDIPAFKEAAVASEAMINIDEIGSLNEGNKNKLSNLGYLIANVDTTDGENTDGNVSTIKVVNKKPTYPSTGGAGTFIGFALIGTAIMLAGIAYFAIYQNDKSRRRSDRYGR